MELKEYESSCHLLENDDNCLEGVQQNNNSNTKFIQFKKIILPCPLLPMASCVAALGGLLFGYDIGIVSGALLQLREQFNLSCKEQEIIVTSLLIGGLLGSLIGGFLVDEYGRRSTIIVNSFVFMVGAALLASSQSVAQLIIGRIVVGFAVSLSAIAECIYISEISPPGRRGFLVSLNELGITLGILLAFLVDFLFISSEQGWRYMFGLSALPAFLQAAGMAFLPPSPRWLLTKRKEKEAKAIMRVLWPNLDVEKECQQLQSSISTEKSFKWSDLFASKDNMRVRFALGCVLVILQQCSGQPTVLYYAPSIFIMLGFHSNVSSTLATVGVGLTKFVFTFMTLMFVDRIGRRRFLLLGCIVMACSLLVLAVVTVPLSNLKGSPACRDVAALPESSLLPTGQGELSVLHSTDWNRTSLPCFLRNCSSLSNITSAGGVSSTREVVKYACLLSLLTFVIGYAIGFGPVSWLLLTEIYPSGIKGRAVAAATVFNWGVPIVLSMTFLDAIKSIGPSFTFMAYALVGLVSVAFVYHFIPETKQRTLEEINEDLMKISLCPRFPCWSRRNVDRIYSIQMDDESSKDDDEAASILCREEAVL